jgi:hypothetical protein
MGCKDWGHLAGPVAFISLTAETFLQLSYKVKENKLVVTGLGQERCCPDSFPKPGLGTDSLLISHPPCAALSKGQLCSCWANKGTRCSETQAMLPWWLWDSCIHAPLLLALALSTGLSSNLDLVLDLGFLTPHV